MKKPSVTSDLPRRALPSADLGKEVGPRHIGAKSARQLVKTKGLEEQ